MLELFVSDVVRCARTCTRECQLARACTHRLHQIGEGAIGPCRVHGKHARRADEITDWIKADEWIKTQLAQMRPDQKGWRVDQQRFSVRGSARHCFGADHGTS